MAETPSITLGSGSPRRAALLTELGVPFQIEVVEIDEAVDHALDVVTAVRRIAEAKFAAFGPNGPRSLLTADTLVSVDGHVLGKPATAQDVAEMLRRMSGRPVLIATGLCYGRRGAAPDIAAVTTAVVLRDLGASEIDAYAHSGVGLDKAGGLALQDEAGSFIADVDGCWANVLGLPLCAVARALDLAPHGAPRSQRCSVGFCGSRGQPLR